MTRWEQKWSERPQGLAIHEPSVSRSREEVEAGARLRRKQVGRMEQVVSDQLVGDRTRAGQYLSVISWKRGTG